MILEETTAKHKGKIINHFEDAYGNELEDLSMVDAIIIVFEDGSRIDLRPDRRGNECYLSQVMDAETARFKGYSC